MNFVIIATTDINSVDFTQTAEIDGNSCLSSPDGKYKIVKFEGDIPSSISSIKIDGYATEYNNIHDVIVDIDAWGAN